MHHVQAHQGLVRQLRVEKALVEKLTDAQVKDFVKEFRAEVDKEVSDGRKTYEATLKKKFDFVERKPETVPGGGEPNPGEQTTESIVAAAVISFNYFCLLKFYAHSYDHSCTYLNR